MDLDSIIPDKPTIQYHEFECYRCGFGNRFIKPQYFIDYKIEADLYKKKLNGLIHYLNSAMAYAERHYGLNPFKDSLIDELTKLRDKYSD